MSNLLERIRQILRGRLKTRPSVIEGSPDFSNVRRNLKEEMENLLPRESEDLVYLSWDVVEELMDIAKTLTKFEKGGFACGKSIRGGHGWRGHHMFYYYDFVPCRNSSPQPEFSYRPYEKCQEEVKDNYEAYSLLHAHPPTVALYTLPSMSDLEIMLERKETPILKSSVRNCFLIGSDTFITYAEGHPFTIIFGNSETVRSKSITEYQHPRVWVEYKKRIKKNFPSQYEDFQFAVASHTTLKGG